ncbi:kinase-like protein [Coniochaeta ligniaria NRRL 30616]|uniref:EKC/KEOPS complex subunit BUD32 n=1 Tax=Coniochaeta ligniaria NRRL 30616 TaxID=1408157 RepID=A0A1J7IKU6_9PEZI|nr:kinase-like protein [Coniochaeta ligniaria NRRL 30616]
MPEIQHHGSTAILTRIRPGVLLKSPFEPNLAGPNVDKFKERVRLAFAVEEPILRRLGDHPRIVQYLGQRDQGFLLSEASHGNLQAYISAHNSSITPCLRKKWCRQAAEAVSYIHSRGVVHSDMRPENFLVHESSPGCLDLLLCDFGGARCDELGLDGKHLPDGPFYDPTQAECSSMLDIFSLGSIFYTIMTGLWPYRSCCGPFRTAQEMLDYDAKVNELFSRGQYPGVDDLAWGDVIKGCWTKQYQRADDILEASREGNANKGDDRLVGLQRLAYREELTCYGYAANGESSRHASSGSRSRHVNGS